MHEPSLPILSLWSAGQDVVGAGLPSTLERTSGTASDPAAALQQASREFPGRDVLLCAESAVWPADGWKRLWAAWKAAPDASVLSALDTDLLTAAIGMDDQVVDAACWAWGEHASFASDLLSIRASLWRADAAAAAITTVTSNLLVAPARARFLPCLWVGGQSKAWPPQAAPRGWHVALDAIAQNLRAATAQTVPRLARDRPVVLHLLHGWGGGVARFARDLAEADHEREHLLLVARGDEHYAPFGRYFDLHSDLEQPPLRRWALGAPIPDTVMTTADSADILAQVIADWGVGAVLVSSLVGHSLDALRTGLPTTWCAHDAYPFWPLLHDVPAGDADRIGDAELATRIARIGPSFLFPRTDATHWRNLRDATVAALHSSGANIVWPSESARQRLLAIVPALADIPGRVIALGSAPMPGPSAWHPDAAQPLRVLMPGHLTDRKGEHLLAELLPLLGPEVQLLALGCGDAAAKRLQATPGLVVQARYAHKDLADWVARLAPDIAMLPSTVPETWSYAYSEMCALGIPTLCPTLGALEDRIRDSEFGWLEPPTGAAFAARLHALAANRAAVTAMRARPAPALPSLEAMATAWRSALPSNLTEPTLAPATTLRTAQVVATVMRGSATAQAKVQAELRAQLSEVEANAELSQEKLKQAYQMYERDTREIARQRDAVLHLRDVGDAEIARLLASNSWRLTRPLRFFNRLARRLRADFSYRIRRFRSRVARGLASIRSRGFVATLRHWRMLRAMSATMPVVSRVAEALPAVDLANLRLPQPKAPRASIVIPVYNQLDFTLRCLQSLAASGDATAFEVIVVDDASNDDSARLLPEIAGLRYHRNTQNLGFIGACNAGAELAKGEFVVFLNNDTEVSQGWLDALLSTFTDHPDTGLAGSKLVYPDGRLQEAGGIIFSDGSAWNYGRYENPDDPRFNFVREVDYCSGAAIALRRGLFNELSGFDALYSPAYYEDADLAMRVRKHGLKVRYQPASTVVHFEGITSGTDLSQGTKAYQVTNQKKFFARWRETLASAHPSPRASSDIARAADHGKPLRVLVVDACTPMPDRDAGSVRMLELMRVLLDQGCAVSFFADNHAYDGHYTTDLQRFGIEAWWGSWLGDTPSWLGKNGSRFDLVIVSRHYILSPLLPLLREYAPKAQVVFDTVDLHFLREEREAEQADDRLRHVSARRTRDSELRLVKLADATWVVSGFEQALLKELVPEATVAVVSTIHTVITDTAVRLGRQDLIFVGGYRHPPNVDAALWMAKDILPRVRARYPSVRLHLVGSEAPPVIMALAALDGVVFHGHVPDLDALLDTSLIGLAPLRFGAGVKGKINQYLSRGLPVVATTCATEGMHLVNERDVLVADNADGFADAVARLMDDEALWQRLREGGWDNTNQFFSRDTAKAALAPLLDSLRPR